jgi:hypothetical protein
MTCAGRMELILGAVLRVPELIQVCGLPQGVPYAPTIMFQLTGWVYCFSSRSQISDGDKLPSHLLDTYRACLSWYDSALQSMSDQHGAGPFVQYAILSYPQVE